MYCIALHCIALHCIVLYCIIVSLTSLGIKLLTGLEWSNPHYYSVLQAIKTCLSHDYVHISDFSEHSTSDSLAIVFFLRKCITYLNKDWRLFGINIEPRSQILLGRAADDCCNVQNFYWVWFQVHENCLQKVRIFKDNPMCEFQFPLKGYYCPVRFCGTGE